MRPLAKPAPHSVVASERPGRRLKLPRSSWKEWRASCTVSSNSGGSANTRAGVETLSGVLVFNQEFDPVANQRPLDCLDNSHGRRASSSPRRSAHSPSLQRKLVRLFACHGSIASGVRASRILIAAQITRRNFIPQVRRVQSKRTLLVEAAWCT